MTKTFLGEKRIHFDQLHFVITLQNLCWDLGLPLNLYYLYIKSSKKENGSRFRFFFLWTCNKRL